MGKKKLWMLAAILVICGATVLTSCSKDDDNSSVIQPTKEYFTLWNQCEALTALQDYVKDVTTPSSPNYIKEEDRIATFDMDGTFVGELYPTYFEYNLLEYRALDDASYQAPKDVMETAQDIRDFVRNGKKLPDHFDMKHAYAAAKAYSGMTLAQFDAYVKAYAQQPANGFSGMTYGQSFYKPMLEVFDYLKANGFTYYVVSGSDRFICRALTEDIGIPSNRVIGMDVKLHSTSQGEVEGVNYTMGKEEDLVRTDELIIKNLKTNKVLQISQEIGKVPVLSFGNSGGDAAMHNYALGNPQYKSAAFMLIADDDARDHANREKALKLGDQWREAGYHVISMRDDFKTIYGDDVVKTDFSFPVDTRALTEWQAGRTVSQADVDAFGGIDKCFAAEPIPDGVWARMQGKTYKENPYIGRADLRHIRALHWDNDNQMHVGEMVCNVQIADRLVTILRKLFDAKYPIQRMLLPDVYDADDERQMEDNNSSCFCYRNIAATTNLSKHARGLAVDINTLYNPYIKTLDDGTLLIQPITGQPYCDRSLDFPYKITHDDLCFKLFTEAGFEWGGDWTTRKDYQHFEIIEPSPVVWEKGVLPGRFTVNAEGLQVQFAQGNLQYQASSHTWRFAEHQYDIVGDATIGNVYENGVKSDNTAISSNYNGWIDLFGWGTGINPTLATTMNGDYSVYSEWGDNAIQNSPGYTWRTLTSEENGYLFHDRTNADKLFSLGSVNGVNGVILLPDDWTTPAGLSYTPSTTKGLEWNGTYYFNENADNYSHNTYTLDEWKLMESAGAVFLPAAGYREGTNVSLVGIAIDYWLATQHGTVAGGISGNSKRLHPHSDGDLYYGDCVRLVR